MFITDFAGSIYSANLDGSNKKTLLFAAGQPHRHRLRRNLKVTSKGELTMSTTKPIRRVAIIGTGVIGASWAALFLAKGLEVVATDVAPNAEAALKRFVEAAWPALKRLGLAPGASQSKLTFTARACGGGQGRGPRPGEWARADRLQEEALWAARRAVAARRDHRVELVRAHDERDPIGCRVSPRALRDRPSFQSAPSDPAGRDRRRREDLGRDDSARHGILHGHGEAAGPAAQGTARACRQSSAGRP